MERPQVKEDSGVYSTLVAPLFQALLRVLRSEKARLEEEEEEDVLEVTRVGERIEEVAAAERAYVKSGLSRLMEEWVPVRPVTKKRKKPQKVRSK